MSRAAPTPAFVTATIAAPDDFESWRDAARDLVRRGVPPGVVSWQDGESGGADLFGALSGPASAATVSGGNETPVRASKAFVEQARLAILHRDPARLDLLYSLLWRLQVKPRLCEDPADPEVRALAALVKQVRRDIHKMRAFVRFRAVPSEPGSSDQPGSSEEADAHYVAWFEPEHRIERHNARFFVDRFASQRWSILTPRLSLHWDGTVLGEGPAARGEDAPGEDATEDLWRGYYRSIFNPARLKVGAMVKEMPRRYWKNLPEAREIADLVAGAQRREAAMIASGADAFAAPVPQSLEEIAAGIAACTRCPIGCNGTRAVPGEGAAGAQLMILGEQPGDNEEIAARPFVGPAGQLLDRHLREAGIEREQAYVTNATKHFKFTRQGKRRLHQNPTAHEIDTCRWWLDAERTLVRPRLILALGASAGRALLGRTPALARERDALHHTGDGTALKLSVHPSYLLRLDGEARAREEARFAADLRAVAEALRAEMVGGVDPSTSSG